MARFLTQADIPPAWPDTLRPNPFADLTGRPEGRYFGWPVAHRSPAGDVWQLAAARFAVLPGLGSVIEFGTLAEAVSHLGR